MNRWVITVTEPAAWSRLSAVEQEVTATNPLQLTQSSSCNTRLTAPQVKIIKK